MSKLTLEELEYIDKVNESDEFTDETLMIHNCIAEYYDADFKKLFIRQIIEKSIAENGNTCDKNLYNVLIANHAIKETIEKYKHLFPKTSVEKSNIHGKGLIAKNDIKSGKFITFYPVHYIFESKSSKMTVSPDFLQNNLSPFDFKVHEYIIGFEDVDIIGGHPRLYNDYENGHMINHSEDASAVFYLVNAETCPVWMVIARKNIKKDEEITVNYGPRWSKIFKSSQKNTKNT